jgi:hypothetical protein
MTIYSLYIKTHNQTGLKYLGITKKTDPHAYKGSGTYWRRHINKYGYDVTTEVISRCKDKTELMAVSLFFSKLFDVVQSTEWANLIDEEGKPNFPKNRVAWNKGLTKSDSRIAKGAKTLSNVKMGKLPKHLHDPKILAKKTIALKGHSQSTKGKTYEEIYGSEKAAELKIARSKTFSNYWVKQRI